MNSVTLLTKVSANPTVQCWAQAYAILQLFIVLSLEQEENGENEVGLYGKKVLERLQREYFAQEEKTLLTVKEAVQKSLQEIPADITCSLTLATIIDDTLFIVISGEGSVLLKRTTKMGTIAYGTLSTISTFSGKLHNEDIIILQTRGFSQRLEKQALYEVVHETPSGELTEVLIPLIHEKGIGNEAVIVVQFTSSPTQAPQPLKAVAQEESIVPEPSVQRPSIISKLRQIPFSAIVRQAIRLTIKHYKIALIALALLILSIIFFFNLSSENEANTQKKSQEVFATVYTDSLEKYDEAVALVSLNKGLARKNLNDAQKSLRTSLDSFPEGSEERKKVTDLLAKIGEKLKELEGGVVVQEKEVVADPKISSPTKLFVYKEAVIVANNSGKIAIIQVGNTDTSSTDMKTIIDITGNDTHWYILAENGVFKVQRGNAKESENIIELDKASYESLGLFSANVYLLNNDTNSIEKYSDPSYGKSLYTPENALPASSSLSIDGSVWVLTTDGKILKFVKGKQDSFALKNMPVEIGSGSSLQTQEGADNLYIFDKKNKKIIVIKKSGLYSQQYDLQAFGDVKDASVDIDNQKGYVLSGDTVYSFNL